MLPGFLKRWLLKRALKNQLGPFLERVKQVELLRSLWISKKAAAVVAGVLVVLLRELVGLDDATVEMIVELIMTYLFAQGGVDAVLAFRGEKKG